MSLSSHLAPDESPTPSSVPPAWSRRMVAFGMDFILLSVFLELIRFTLPQLFEREVQEEFTTYLHRLNELQAEHPYDFSVFEEFIRSFNPSPQVSMLFLFMSLLIFLFPITYFFIGEFFFSGKSLGKATFGLQTVRVGDSLPPQFLASLGRSMVKGFASLILLPLGFVNFVSALFNPDRRCLHDFLSRTVTVQTITPPPEVSATSEGY